MATVGCGSLYARGDGAAGRVLRLHHLHRCLRVFHHEGLHALRLLVDVHRLEALRQFGAVRQYLRVLFGRELAGLGGGGAAGACRLRGRESWVRDQEVPYE